MPVFHLKITTNIKYLRNDKLGRKLKRGVKVGLVPRGSTSNKMMMACKRLESTCETWQASRTSLSWLFPPPRGALTSSPSPHHVLKAELRSFSLTKM